MKSDGVSVPWEDHYWKAGLIEEPFSGFVGDIDMLLGIWAWESGMHKKRMKEKCTSICALTMDLPTLLRFARTL